MSALSDAAQFAQDETLRPILSAALVRAAVEIQAEDPSTPHHAERAALAKRVVLAPQEPSQLSTFAWALSTNATVVDKWIDGDTEGASNDFAFVLGSVWNAVAV